MRNTKLYWILQNFDKYEQNRLRKFLQSPYFNKDVYIINLFSTLVDDVNKLLEKTCGELYKEEVWKKIRPEEGYDDVRFRKYCSDLLKVIESYLAQQIYEEKATAKTLYLMEAIGKRKLDRLKNDVTKHFIKTSQQVFHKSSEFYLEQYVYEKNFYELHKHDRTSRTNVEDINKNLDIFFVSEKLKYYCLSLGQQKVASHIYKIEFIDDIKKKIEKGAYEDIPSIAIYYQILLMEGDGSNPEHYFKLKELLEKNGLKFPREEAESMYGFALNHCISKINRGEQDFQKELFDLYKDSLKKEIIIVDGELSPWDFRNISNIALRLGEYVWVQDFIDRYSAYLPENFRENAVAFNLAQLYFYQKKYDALKTILREVVFEDFSYNLNTKVMLLLTYYETDEIEPLQSLIESFRTYLNRHKDIPTLRRQNYLNLIKFTKRLTNIIPGDKKSIQKLKQELEATKNVASHAWLMEKIAELE